MVELEVFLKTQSYIPCGDCINIVLSMGEVKQWKSNRLKIQYPSTKGTNTVVCYLNWGIEFVVFTSQVKTFCPIKLEFLLLWQNFLNNYLQIQPTINSDFITSLTDACEKRMIWKSGRIDGKLKRIVYFLWDSTRVRTGNSKSK